MSVYLTYTDQELLDLTDAKLNRGPIPFGAVKEVQRRGLKKFINRTINSNDFKGFKK